MYKNIFIIVLILFVCSSSQKAYKNTSENCSDTISWSENHRLVWDDFKGIPDTTMIAAVALTFSEIVITDSKYVNEIPKYKLACHFIKSKSWTKVSDNETLSHEQLHFDIAEIYTRKIRKAFDSLNSRKVKNIDIYNNVYNFYGKQCDDYQKTYDSEVYFNSVAQQKWSQKIAQGLRKLDKHQAE